MSISTTQFPPCIEEELVIPTRSWRKILFHTSIRTYSSMKFTLFGSTEIFGSSGRFAGMVCMEMLIAGAIIMAHTVVAVAAIGTSAAITAATVLLFASPLIIIPISLLLGALAYYAYNAYFSPDQKADPDELCFSDLLVPLLTLPWAMLYAGVLAIQTCVEKVQSLFQSTDPVSALDRPQLLQATQDIQPGLVSYPSAEIPSTPVSEQPSAR